MNKICETYSGLIIKAAYNDATIAERIRVHFHLRNCKECRNLFKSHQVTAKILHRLPEMECPDSLIEKVLFVVDDAKYEKPSFLFDFYSVLSRVSIRKLAFGFVIITMIIVFALFNRYYNKSSHSKEYSEEQIEKANIQAQQALTLLGRILNTTQAKLEKEILPEKVAKPINKSFYVINDLFKSGDKNESH